MSGALKILIGAVILGVVALGVIAITQGPPSPPITDTPIVRVNTPTHIPHTPTVHPPSHTPTRTPTGTPPPTDTFTPTPTPSETPTPQPRVLIPYLEQVDNAYEIFISNEDGRQRQTLTKGSTTGNFDPVLSPDGKSVAFWSFGSLATLNVPPRELYVVNLNDRRPRLLLSGQPYDSRIVWSPKSDYLAVTLNVPNDGVPMVDVYLVPVAGGDPQRLTSPQLDDYSIHTDPSFSPDGSQIAYVPHKSTESPGYSINVVNADGSNLQLLNTTINDVALEVHGIAWSPVENQIAFIGRDSSLGSMAGIYLINGDGSGLTPWIKTAFASGGLLAWSMNGEHLAFTADNDLWVLAKESPEPRLVVRGLSADASGCTFVPWFIWLSDGRRLAYNTDRDGPIEIHTITLDGSDDRTLKTTPPSYLRLPQGCPTAPIETATPVPVIP